MARADGSTRSCPAHRAQPLAFPGLLLAILFTSVYGEGLAAPVVALVDRVSAVRRPAWPAPSSWPNANARTWPPTRCKATPVPTSACGTSSPTSRPSSSPNAPSTSATPSSTWPALSFLGLGVPALTPDWGRMVFDGKSAIQSGYPLSAIVPCAVIILTVVAFNVVGERWADKVAGRNR
ncbi:hypothetical protein ACU686_08180 [Yinghuangia aomiensis]